MTRLTRPIWWMTAAHKDFMCFPEEAQRTCLRALTVAAWRYGRNCQAHARAGVGSI